MVSSTIFKVFGMTRPGIEPRSPGPLANTLTAGPMSQKLEKKGCPVGWGCRIYRLHSCREVRPLPSNVLFMTLNNLMVSNAAALRNAEYPLLSSLPGPRSSGVAAPDRILFMSQTDQNSEHLINWIAWNRTVFTFKLRTDAKPNCLKWTIFVC